MKIEVDDFINKKNIVKNINQTNLKAFQIEGLFGEYTVKLDFDNKVNVFVGKNGFGKTTILQCLYYTLKRNYILLSEIPFNKLTIYLTDNESYSISKSELKILSNELRERYDFDFDDDIIDAIQNYCNLNGIDTTEFSKLKYMEQLSLSRRISEGVELPNPIVRRYIRAIRAIDFLENEQVDLEVNNISKFFKIIRNKLEEEIVYLPTYRRIEKSIGGMKSSIRSLFHSGMDDIDKSIQDVLTKIKEQTMIGYNKMTGILLEEYSDGNNSNKKSYKPIDKDIANIVLSRLEGEIETNCKEKILNIIEDGSIESNNYLNNLLQHLIDNYNTLKTYDDVMKNFVETCNHYLEDKEFLYDPSSLDYRIQMKTSKSVIDINDLSSGEKQIVALFAMIYLDFVDEKQNKSIQKKKIILIDEPELSLSLKWQRMLLPDIAKSEKCSMLVAMTHSPFIFDNEFDDFTKEIHRNLFI